MFFFLPLAAVVPVMLCVKSVCTKSYYLMIYNRWIGPVELWVAPIWLRAEFDGWLVLLQCLTETFAINK